MSAYDDYKKGSDEILKKYEAREKEIHDEALSEIDKKAKDAFLNFMFFMAVCIALFALAGLGLSAAGLLK